MSAMLAVAHEFGFRIAAFHHATEAYKIAADLRRADTCVAVWSDWWGYKMEALDAVRANAPFIDSTGGCVLMHSDSAIVGQRLNIEAAKAAASWRRTGGAIPEERMIRWITSAPARVLGLGDRVGTLAPGRNADLVLWSGNPFSIYSKPDLVLIDGAIVFDRASATPARWPDFSLGRPESAATP
jgi:imidazolonepropionase-like amidohydrolase